MKIEEYTAYWCKTKELRKEFFKECKRQGFEWLGGTNSTNGINYNRYKEETCYIVSIGKNLSVVIDSNKHACEAHAYKIVEYKGKQEDKLKFNDYSELSLYIDEHYNEVEDIISYDSFSIIKIGEQYFYMEESLDGDADEFYEVEVIAELEYSIENDLNKNVDGEKLAAMFECDCCGEYVTNDCIKYLWFKEVK